MNSIGLAGAKLTSQTTRPSPAVSVDPERLGRQCGRRAYARERGQQHRGDRPGERAQQRRGDRLEDERFGGLPGGPHEAVGEPAVRDEAAVRRRIERTPAPDLEAVARRRSGSG